MASNYVCRTCIRALRQQRPHRSSFLPIVYASGAHTAAATKPPQKQREVPPPQNQAERDADLEMEKRRRTGRLVDAKPEKEDLSSLPLPQRLGIEMRKRTGGSGETYVAYGSTELLYKECAKQADYDIPQAKEEGKEIPKTKYGEDLGVGTGWWYDELGLTPTLNTWAQITFLHMYLLHARLRLFPPEHVTKWNQHLIDHFFYDAEHRMDTVHRMTARSVRNGYLKDLFVQWRGVIVAYDEGLVRNDAVLAAAVWRNVFKAAGNAVLVNPRKGEVRREEEVDWVGVAQIVSWMRREVQRLERMSDTQIAAGDVAWGSPEHEKAFVLMEHRGMSEPFAEAPKPR